MRVIIATGNKNKVREFKEMLPDEDVMTMREAGFEGDIEETGSTFAENAYIKAKSVWDKTGGMVIADDSGLSIEALGGEPGIYSARYLGESTSYADKNKGILERMKNVPKEKRNAMFTCSMCAIMPDGHVLRAEEHMKGIISQEPSGSNGFGYDPILYLPEFGCTAAELSSEEKNAISHRGKALRALTDSILIYNTCCHSNPSRP